MIYNEMTMSFYLIIAIIISVSIIPVAFAELQSDIDLLLERGTNFYHEGKYDLALSSFDKILELDPDNTEAILKKVQVFYKLEKPDEAMSNIDKVLEIEPNNIDALTYKADDLVLQNNTKDAKQFYEKIISQDSQNAAAMGFLGDDLVIIGDSKQASSLYEKVVELEPYKTDPFSVPYFDKLLEIEPNSIEGLNAKGASMVKLGRSEGGFTIVYIDNLEEAISYFDQAINLEPNNVDALLNKGKALFQLGKSEEGMDYVDRALEIDPDNLDVLTFKGDELLRVNQTEQGSNFIERALEIDPNNVDGLFLKGRLLVLQKNYDDAFTYFDKVLELNSNNIIAAQNIKFIAASLGTESLDGFLDVKVHDSLGFLVGHLRINNLKLLNQTIAENLIDEWPVTQVISRNGQNYEVLQHKVSKDVFVPKYNGGASHYGIRYSHYDQVWALHANYWMYQVNLGDRVDFVYTAFRPV